MKCLTDEQIERNINNQKRIHRKNCERHGPDYFLSINKFMI